MDEDDDWEWRLAVARARAAEPELEDEEDWESQIAAARAQGSSTDMMRPARRAPPPPPRPKSGTQPLGSSAPRTIIAVPALPVVDPQLVRSYVRRNR